MNSPKLSPPVGFRPFLVMSATWLLSAYLAGRLLTTLPFGFVVLSVFLFAIPISLSGAYSNSVNQTHSVSYYKETGWAYKLLSQRIIGSVLWVVHILAQPEHSF